MKQEWFTAAELAGMSLPEVPTTDRGVRLMADRYGWQHPDREWSAANPLGVWRRRQGRGGGVEYHYALLPARARAEVVRRHSAAPELTPEGTRKKAKERLERSEAWGRFERLVDGAKAKAMGRLGVIVEVDDMTLAGTAKELALRLVCDRRRIATRTYYDWESRIHGVERADWLPYLADHYIGRTSTAEMSPEAWEYFKADWLTQSQPALMASYTRTVEAGEGKGWIIPCAKTFKRRVQREIPAEVVVRMREGDEAVARMYPAQRRDRSSLHALEAVNWDGHKFDVFCRWPDGTIGRPIASVFQDLYSGKILAWRIDRSENTDAFRLAFGDMAERYGYPDHIVIDNTLTAANKEMTGGTPNRYRFKIKPDDQHGVFTILGIKVHWTQVYHGQSKPIERAFGDLCAQYISRSPECVGAYTGNNPMAKPENYGSKAIPFDIFIGIVEREIRRHNAREKRESRVCGGVMSFDQAFEASYANAPIRKALPDHRFLWMLKSEVVTARKPDGHVELAGNRYWCPQLARLIGTKVVLRYDPTNLHQDIRVYRLDGAFIATAELHEDTGFFDEAGKEKISKARRSWVRGTKMASEAMVQMTAAQAGAQRPVPPEEVLPEAKVVRATFGNLALKPAPAEDAADPEPKGQTINFFDHFARGVALLRPGQE